MSRPSSPRYPGIPTVADGSGAVVACEKEAADGTAEVLSAPATRMGALWSEAAGAGHFNISGRPLLAVEVGSELEAAAAVAGLALTGLRTTAFLSDRALPALQEELASMAGRHLTTVLHVACGAAGGSVANFMGGHGAYHAAADSGWFQFFAKDVQEAADLCLIAHRVAEHALLPGFVAQDAHLTARAGASILLPERELVAEYLGSSEEVIEPPTSAQRLLFGAGRRRVPELWSVDRPALAGAPLGEEVFAQGVAAQGLYFAAHLPELADQAMEAFSQLTGRPYGRLGTWRTEDADYLIVAQGGIVPVAEAVADYLRRTRRIKAGVINLRMFRPFPGELLGQLLRRRKGVVVCERLAHPQAEDGPLMREVRAAAGKCGENGRAGRGEAPFPGYAAYRKAEDAPPLYAAAYGMGGREPEPEGLIGAVENMLPGGSARRRVFLAVDFTREAPRSPKEEIFLQTLGDEYPAGKVLRARGSENPDLLPKGAVSVRLHAPAGREVWSQEENLAVTLAELKGLHVRTLPEAGEPVRGRGTAFRLAAAAEPLRAVPPSAPVDLVAVSDPHAFVESKPLNGLKEGGTLIVQSDRETPHEVWATIPEDCQRIIAERGVRLYYIDALRIAGEETRDPALRYRIMGRVLEGSALATAPLEALTRLTDKHLVRALREMLRLRAGDGQAEGVEEDLRVFRRGMEELVPVRAMAGGEAPAPSKAAAPPTVLKGRPAHPAPAMDIHRLWEEVGIPYARGAGWESLAEPFLASGWLPAASAVFRDFAPTRRNYPHWIAEKCTGCGDCWLVCPDSALPGLVNGIGELLETVVRSVEAQGHGADHLPRAVRTLEGRLRERLAKGGEGVTFGEQLLAAISDVLVSGNLGGETRLALEQQFIHFEEALAGFPLAVTEPYFTEMEKASRGSGGLLSITLDPSKCKGCMACVRACPEEALAEVPQEPEELVRLRRHWEFWLRLPTTDPRYISPPETPAAVEGAPGLERLLLDKRAYHSLTGGDESLPGAAEKTVLHLFTATVTGLMQPRVVAHLARLQELIEGMEHHMRLALAVEVEDPAELARAMDELKEGEFTLADLSGKLDRERSPVDTEWLRRVTGVLTVLKQLRERYLGDGPEGARAALGMVHGTTGGDGWEVAYPYNPFPFPWTGHAGGASAALALGLYEGHMARMAEGFKAIRMAELELDERYNPEIHDLYFARFDWRELSAEEFLLCPPVVLAGSDRELYGAGLGGVSALLRSGKPVKLLCLDTGAYSHLAGALGEPRGEASAGGAGSHGAQRRQMTLLGMAHRAAFIAQGSLANLPHLLQSFAAGLGATRPALFNVYCSRLPAHGLGDDQAVRQSRLALESRAHPVFRFDPDAPGPLHERLSLEGNPAPEELWPAYELNHLDEHGAPQTLELPMTFADFAAAVPGLEHHFQLVGEETPEESLLPLDEFLELEPDEREEARPFIQALAAEGRLQRLLVSPALVDACMERKQYWETLRELTRRDIVPVDEEAISAEAREEMVVKVTERLLELVQNREGLSSALTRAAGLEGDGAADPGDSHA